MIFTVTDKSSHRRRRHPRSTATMERLAGRVSFCAYLTSAQGSIRAVLPLNSQPTNQPKIRVALCDLRCAWQSPPFLQHVFWPASHCQNDAELCIAAHHSRISLCCFFERLCFNHGTHASEFGESQSVLGIAWCSRGPALNASASTNELHRCDPDGIKCHTHQHELAVRPQPVDQFGHRFRAWRCRQNDLCAAQFLQCLYGVRRSGGLPQEFAT